MIISHIQHPSLFILLYYYNDGIHVHDTENIVCMIRSIVQVAKHTNIKQKGYKV